jgi:hypothetical protein
MRALEKAGVFAVRWAAAHRKYSAMRWDSRWAHRPQRRWLALISTGTAMPRPRGASTPAATGCGAGRTDRPPLHARFSELPRWCSEATAAKIPLDAAEQTAISALAMRWRLGAAGARRSCRALAGSTDRARRRAGRPARPR